MSFGAYDVERRTRKDSFYAQVDTIIDWKLISIIQLVEMLCFEYALIKNKIKLKKAKKRLILIKIARKKMGKTHKKTSFF
ncbi:hypothetical protein [Bergeyella zoohelcum]|uniref:Uncharacterized protein n=1 Tax=Bergeyella zoohelcum TaxID=1015 RepID=A0A376C027_9FLAO|nr:hypothetical protein [Bergeyella zoohelcum]EKB57106.1 hypothetical protein HMPREF9700_02323 [Bergeyella zoohelcum CCUG 30536]SSZ55538.1 Uncharacterised protein [Bergeyella zoohelcum]